MFGQNQKKLQHNISKFFLVTNIQGVPILSVNIFGGDRGPRGDQLLPFAFFCFGIFEIFAKKLTIFENTFSKISL